MFNVPMRDRSFFKVYGGGTAQIVYSTVFIYDDVESYYQLWHALTQIELIGRTGGDSHLLRTWQSKAIGLALALNP